MFFDSYAIRPPPGYFGGMECAMEKAVRVLVANRPRLMRETILTTFADQPDIEIVGEVADDSEIMACVERTLPNFVVIALDQPGRMPRVCNDLLREHPEVRVIAVAPEKNFVVYYWASLDIHSNDIEASEEGILNVMRSRMVANGAN
jgi:chemotaxis response regulator CheB